MKNNSHYLSIAVIIFAAIIIISGCKKKAEDPVPVFTMSADTVNLQAGGKGLQFFATCTNNGVSMQTVTITTPQDSLYIYQANGASFEQNAFIPMQESSQAYPKILGTWKFNLVGSSAGGTAFTIDETIAIIK